MPEPLATLLARYGYVVVFLGVFLENLGVPVPGETVLLAAGFLAHRGAFSLPWVVALGITAAILGDNLGYWIGRRGGRPLAERHGRLLGLTPSRLAAFDAFFARHGAKTVFFARFITGLRVVAALLTGMSGLPWPQFLRYNAAGAVTWATAVVLAGYLFGQSLDLLHRWTGRAGLFGLALVGALIALALLRRMGQTLLAQAKTRPRIALTLREIVLVATSLGGIALFAKLAEDVVNRESSAFDAAVFTALHRFATPWLDRVMTFLSALGSPPAIVAIVLAALAWCLDRSDRRAAAVLAAVAASTEALNWLLKSAFHRTRPPLAAAALPASYSFPSGHAMAAAGIYGVVAVILARLEPRLRRPLAWSTPPLTLLIGISRVYLGQHWATDVLAGFAAGVAILVGGVYALDRRAGSRGVPPDRAG